jgi:hypothetical protein
MLSTSKLLSLFGRKKCCGYSTSYRFWIAAETRLTGNYSGPEVSFWDVKYATS